MALHFMLRCRIESAVAASFLPVLRVWAWIFVIIRETRLYLCDKTVGAVLQNRHWPVGSLLQIGPKTGWPSPTRRVGRGKKCPTSG